MLDLGRSAGQLHRLEMAVVVLSTLNLCFLPWAFGGVDPWSQLVSLGLATGTAVVALLPRRHSSRSNSGCEWRMSMWSRLRSFPVFWAGLALFAYMAVQAFNPAFEYHLLDTTWWLVRLDHVRWIPSGMIVPYNDMNTWRTMVIWGSCWLTVCALWVGITRRRSILWILTGLSVNAAAFAAFGILQRAGGATSVYWTRPVQNVNFVAGLIYENHASPFFSLLACIALGLTIQFLRRGGSHQDDSGPAIIYLFLALLSIVGLILSCSFAGIALFVSALLVMVLVLFWRRARASSRPHSTLPFIITAGFLLLLGAGLTAAVGYRDLQKKLASIAADGGGSEVKIRMLADARGWEMFADRWVFGWGAGCFRYGFTKYQHREPVLSLRNNVPLRWEHVHDDWLQLLIELGVVGAIPVGFVLGYWLRQAFRFRLWRCPAKLPILCGLAVPSVHAFFDLPFQNPAVLATVCALLPLLIRWAEIESQPGPTIRHGVSALRSAMR